MTQEEIKSAVHFVDTKMGFEIPAIHLGDSEKGDLYYAQNRLFTVKNDAINEIILGYCIFDLLDDYLKTI